MEEMVTLPVRPACARALMALAVLDFVLSSNDANNRAVKVTNKLEHFASNAYKNPLKPKSIEQHHKRQ